MPTLPDENARCTRCGRTFGSLLRLAFIADLSITTGSDPSACKGGKDHDFPED